MSPVLNKSRKRKVFKLFKESLCNGLPFDGLQKKIKTKPLQNNSTVRSYEHLCELSSKETVDAGSSGPTLFKDIFIFLK